ncbi:putative ribonuclease H-like domain-containing protein [Tanacetum coccineum]|uniref:Ribonuclease H-like domain-containing protein n=1 Tax=Tanacetum coccineum TaxID=301880 RepID=A0ABQ5J6A5_9ASTR
MNVSLIPTTRIDKDHPKDQIIGDLNLSYSIKMDVKSAFLYCTIKEEVYVCQPLGFEDPHFLNKVYKVEKALYGLHQAPRAWFHSKTKHTEIRHHFIRDSYKKKLIQVIKIHTDHNVADLLIKDFDVISGPIHLVANEIVYKEWEDRMERAATTTSRLEAEHDSDTQTRFEAASK